MADTKTDDASIEALRSDLERLREDISLLTRHLRGAADETADDVRSRLRDASREAGAAARERWRQGRTSLEAELQDRPLTFIGVAFAAGVLIGRLLGR
jgi:ElaB/YqjD/DUF883 family membrane-anchored ribosome-binding protein